MNTKYVILFFASTGGMFAAAGGALVAAGNLIPSSVCFAVGLGLLGMAERRLEMVSRTMEILHERVGAEEVLGPWFPGAWDEQ